MCANQPGTGTRQGHGDEHGRAARLEHPLALLVLGEHPRDHDLLRHLQPHRIVLGHRVVQAVLAQLLLRRLHLSGDGVDSGCADAHAEGRTLRILEALSRALDHVERLGRERVVRVLIRVRLQRELAVGLLDILVRRPVVHAEDLERVEVEILRARPEQPVDVLCTGERLIWLLHLIHFLQKRGHLAVQRGVARRAGQGGDGRVHCAGGGRHDQAPAGAFVFAKTRTVVSQ